MDSDWLDSVLSLSSSKPCIAMTVPICKHNETIEVVGEIPEEFVQWNDQLEDGTKREKRSDVESPG